MESATTNAAQLCSTGQEHSPEGAEVNKIMPHGQAARRSEPEPQYNAQTCFRCGNRAHHMTPSDNYEAQHVAHEQPGATFNLLALTGSRPDPIVTTVCVDGMLLSMGIDTGATLSIISEETWNQHWSTRALVYRAPETLFKRTPTSV